MLKLLLKGGGNESFEDYAQKVIDQKTLKDGRGYSEETKRRYRDELKRLAQFQPSTPLHQVTPKWLEKYQLWLQNTYRKKDGKLMDPNGIWAAFKFIRMVMNQAQEDQLILPEQNPFKQFKFDGYKAHSEKVKWLDLDQLGKLETVLRTRDLQPMTVGVGWRFLAMCVLGMRISDAMRLNDAFYNDAGDVSFKPHKTRRHGNTATIPIVSDRQRLYLQETMARPLPETDPKNFRTTFNIHLKILAAAAGLPTQLTSHMGRHTMGSFLVDAGIDKKAAMAMLGVKSEKVIETYMHLKQSKLQEEAAKLRKIF
jgi:site-specific recombinase XerD